MQDRNTTPYKNFDDGQNNNRKFQLHISMVGENYTVLHFATVA